MKNCANFAIKMKNTQVYKYICRSFCFWVIPNQLGVLKVKIYYEQTVNVFVCFSCDINSDVFFLHNDNLAFSNVNVKEPFKIK